MRLWQSIFGSANMVMAAAIPLARRSWHVAAALWTLDPARRS